MSRRRPAISSLLRGLLLGCLLAAPAYGQAAEDSLAALLRGQALADDAGALDATVAAHRLDIKAVFDGWMTEAVQARLAGDEDGFRTLRGALGLLGDRFRAVHGERSLAIGAGYLDGWSDGQLRAKLRADSLAESGLALRGASATREAALADYEGALALYREIGDGRGVANVLGGIGYVYFFLDRPKYLAYNLEAASAREAVDDRQLLGNAHSDVGTAYWRFEGDLERARHHYEVARAIREEIGDIQGLGRLLSNLGKVYEAQGAFEEAVAAYTDSGHLLERVDDPGRAADALQLAGLSLSDYFGRHSEALVVMQEARALRERSGDTAGLIGTLNNLGIINRRLGNLDGAVEAYQQVIALSREQGDDLGIARASNNLGVVFLWAERPDRAATYFERALRQFEALADSSGMLDALVNVASSHFESHDYAAARPFAEQALTMARDREDRITETSTLVLLGNILGWLDAADEARGLFATALRQSTDLAIPNLEFSTLLSLGEYHERFGDPDSALVYYDRAFETLEALRSLLTTEEDKAGFLAQQRYAYESVIHFLAKRNADDPDGPHAFTAFDYAERGKARAFLDLLAEALSDVREGVSEEIRQQRQALLDAMADVRRTLIESGADDPAVSAALRDSLAGLEDAYERLERALRADNPRYSELQYPAPSSLADVMAMLPPNAVLLEYALGDSSSAVWAVTRDAARMVMLPPRDRIQEQVDLLRFALTDPSRGSAAGYEETAHALYQSVVAPAADLVDDRPVWIVVPDGALSYVPFEGLVRSRADSAAYTRLDYVARHHAVAYAPSSSVLATLRRDLEKGTGGEGLVAFGDPIFASESIGARPGSLDPTADLARLPYTGDEVRAIADLFPEGRSALFVRDAATEEAITSGSALAGYRYVHFATHGLINEDRPDFSGLALTANPGAGSDGFLQVAEIFNLRLDADLVVLSACETGLGRMVRGEGLLGLTRAFLYAGASSVVVSLWSVADRSTSELMQRFYRSMIVEGESKADALRSAKLSMLDDATLAHPFNWAPFTLVGNWD